MWTDSDTMKCFSNTCWLLLLLTVKIAVSDKFLVNKRDSEWHKAVVSHSAEHKADEVSEVTVVKLAGENDNELDVLFRHSMLGC